MSHRLLPISSGQRHGRPAHTISDAPRTPRWMGHRHLSTTQLYADYAPSPHEAAMVARAFDRGSVSGSVLSESEVISDHLSSLTEPNVSEG